MASAWHEQLRGGGFRARYRDASGNKQTVKDAVGRPARYTNAKDAKDAATEAWAKARRRPVSGPSVVSPRIPWGEWWELVKTTRTFPYSDTARVEDSIVRVYLMPQWGDVPLIEITNKAVKAWARDVLATKTYDYASRILGVLRISFAIAVDEGILDASPCVKIPLPKRRSQIKKYMSESDLQAYLPHLRDDYKLIVETAYETGLRPGEICGVHIEDVNLDTGWLVTCHVYVAGKGRVRAYPKDGDVRRVPLTERAVELVKLSIDGRDWTRGCGLPHSDGSTCASELVFRSSLGKVHTPATIRETLHQVHTKHGLPLRSPYTLRRGFVVTSIDAGMDPLTMQLITGHADLDELQGYFQLTERARDRLESARGALRGATLEQQVSTDVHKTEIEKGADQGGVPK